MRIIDTSALMSGTLAQPLDSDLRQLLEAHVRRLSEYQGYDLKELACLIIADPPDTLAAVEETLGHHIIAGDPPEPTWEYIKAHGRWIEIVFILSDDGFGCVLFVNSDSRTNSELANLFRPFCPLS